MGSATQERSYKGGSVPTLWEVSPAGRSARTERDLQSLGWERSIRFAEGKTEGDLYTSSAQPPYLPYPETLIHDWMKAGC